MNQSIILATVALTVGFLIGATSGNGVRANAAAMSQAQKPPRYKHKCERPFNFDELSKMIEAREDQGWEMITVSPVVMSANGGQDANAYLRYVACFKRLATDD